MRFVKYLMLIFLLGQFTIAKAQQNINIINKDSLLAKSNAHSTSLSTDANYTLKTIKQAFIPVVFITYGFVGLNNKEIQLINVNTRNELQEDHPHFSTTIDNYLQLVPSLAVFGLKIGGVQGRTTLKRSALIYGVSAGIMAVSVKVLKNTTHVERPDFSNYVSFPSGHTATAFMGAEFLHQEYKSISPWIGISGYAVAAATGALRMYNNKHWFSDVVAGAGIGMLSTKIAYWIFPDKHETAVKLETNYSMFIPYYNDGVAGLNWCYAFK